MQAQHDLAKAFESHYTEATTLLMSLCERLQEIEQTNELELKRQIIELLVAGIRVDLRRMVPAAYQELIKQLPAGQAAAAHSAQRAALSTQAFSHQIEKILRQARCRFQDALQVCVVELKDLHILARAHRGRAFAIGKIPEFSQAFSRANRG